MTSGSTTGRTTRGTSTWGITTLGVLGDPDPAGTARDIAATSIYLALARAVNAGRVDIEHIVGPDGEVTVKTVAHTTPAEPCPACGAALVVPGAMAPLGQDGVLVSTCLPCASVSRAVDAAFRADPMREVDR